MKITAHTYADGTPYYLASGTFQGRPVLVEALDRITAIIGWINTAQQRAE